MKEKIVNVLYCSSVELDPETGFPGVRCVPEAHSARCPHGVPRSPGAPRAPGFHGAPDSYEMVEFGVNPFPVNSLRHSR